MGRQALRQSAFHTGGHSLYVRYNPDGTVDREGRPEHEGGRLSPRPWPRAYPLPQGQLVRGWGTWTFPERCGAVLTGPRGSFVRMGPADDAVHAPTRAFVRHPKHWVREIACARQPF